MTRSKFENFASSKITQHQSKVDAEALWNAVAPKAPKKKKRVAFWYFATGLLVTGLVSALVWSVTTTTDVEGNSHTAVQSDKGIQQADALTKSAVSENYSAGKDHSSPLHNNPVLEDEKIVTQVQKKSGLSNEIESTSPQGKEIKSKSIFSESNLNEQARSYSEASSDLKEISELNDLNVNTQSYAEASQLDLPIKSIGLANVSIQENTADITNTLLNFSTTVVPNMADVDSSSSKSNASTKHKVVFSVGAYAGISATTSKLTANQSDSSGYINLRNQTEKQLETIQFGFEVGADIFKGVTIKSGMEFSRLARVFTFTDEISVVDSMYGLKEIYVNNQTQDTINVYGQIPVITSTTYNKKIYNNISQIDIPVKVGYTYRSENWSFGIDAGAIINLNTSYTGEIFSPTSEFYDLKSDSESWFETNAGIAFTAGLNVGHRLGSSFEIYLAPVYRSPSVFSTNANPIEQTHARFGANLGLRYLLGQ